VRDIMIYVFVLCVKAMPAASIFIFTLSPTTNIFF